MHREQVQGQGVPTPEFRKDWKKSRDMGLSRKNCVFSLPIPLKLLSTLIKRNPASSDTNMVSVVGHMTGLVIKIDQKTAI